MRGRSAPARTLFAAASDAAVAAAGGAHNSRAIKVIERRTAPRIASDNIVMLELTLIGLLAAAPPALEEVVVTARRREQRLAEVAASVTRVTPGAYGRIDLTHPVESLNRIPGVLLQRGSGQESLLAIRSPVLTGAGACGAFLFLEDDAPLRPTGFCNVNELFEVNTSQAAAIEVLRGPGNVVHGANAVHGVINVVTPSARELEGSRVSLTMGPDEFGTLALSLGDGQTALQGLWHHDDGFRFDSTTREAKINLIHDRELKGGELRLRAAATRLDQDTAGFVRGLDAYRDPVLRRSNANPEAFRDADSLRLSARWTHEPCAGCDDEWRLTLRDSSMEFLQHFLLGKPLERNAQRSALLGFARTRPLIEPWFGEAISLRIGIDAEHASTSLLEIQSGPTLEGSAAARAIRPAGRHYDYAVEVGSVGLGLALEGRVSQWIWRASLRGDHVAYDYDNRMRDGNAAEDGTPCPGGCLYSRPADRQDRFDVLTPRVELIRSLGTGQHLYAALSDGFRPPEITELYRLQRNQNVADLDTERMRAAEIGWRFGLLESEISRLRGSIALFSARKSNVILRDANGFNVIGGRTRHEGLEYELQWRFAESWQASAGGTRARHRYDFSRAIEGGETIVAGRDIDTAPRDIHRLALGAVPTAGTLLEIDVRHTGDYFADAANERRHPTQTTLGLRSRWQATSRVALTLDIDNLTDRLLADRADFAQGDWRYFPARRRSIYLGVDWRSR